MWYEIRKIIVGLITSVGALGGFVAGWNIHDTNVFLKLIVAIAATVVGMLCALIVIVILLWLLISLDEFFGAKRGGS